MKTLPQVDFVARPARPWIGLTLCLGLGAALAMLGWSSWQLEEHNRVQAATLARHAAARAPLAARRPTEAERVRLAQAQTVAGELRAPWSELLAAFEQHGGGDVGLLKLEPDARAGTVRVTGQARHSQALFTYLAALEADPRLEQVLLTTHQTEGDTPGNPVRFTIQAGWRLAPVPAKDVS
jgi:Tfp pilus assembly protein PilN